MTAPAPFLDYDQALTCIHCGLCLGSCPTYLETGDENDSPRGRIYLMRALQAGRLPLGETVVTHIDRCLGCRACEAVCPSGVPYGALLETTREHIETNHRRSLFETFLRRVAIERVFPYPARMKLALVPARLIRGLRLEWLLPAFARDALALIPQQFSEVDLPDLSPAEVGPTLRGGPSPRRRVGFIRGCVQSVLFGDTNAATIKLLNRAGYEVVTPPDQGCCGALFSHSGKLATAREFARRNIAVFERYELDAIVINAAGCGSTLKEYGHLLAGDPEWAARGRAFSAKVKDLSEVLSAQSAIRNPQSAIRVTFHDACHLAHAQRITRQPRELVRAVAGERFVEMPECDVCCGSAGSYNLTEPALAARLQQRKTANILQSGAAIVVTTNPGCILQLRAGLKAAGATHVRVLHLADFLEEAAASERPTDSVDAVSPGAGREAVHGVREP